MVYLAKYQAEGERTVIVTTNLDSLPSDLLTLVQVSDPKYLVNGILAMMGDWANIVEFTDTAVILESYTCTEYTLSKHVEFFLESANR